MVLYVARHGETTWNVEKRLMGTLPGELSAHGLEQARQLGLAAQNLPIQINFVSDLHRTVQTANEVTKLNPELKFTPVEALRERHAGELEGRLFSEFNWTAFWEQPEDETAYNSESLRAFSIRVAQFIVDIETHEHETVLLITHEDTMNRLHFLADPANFSPQKYPNGEIITFDYSAMNTNAGLLLDGQIQKLK